MHEGGCRAITLDPQVACLPGASGKLADAGALVGYDYGFWRVRSNAGHEYNKWIFVADYASGRNYMGGGGFGLYYFFTKDISLFNGPVWFNDHVINGQWKWTTQVHINF
jgi:hypothetical protein